MRTGEALLKRHADPMEGFLHHCVFAIRYEQGTAEPPPRETRISSTSIGFVEEAVVVHRPTS